MTTTSYPAQPHVNGFAALDGFVFEGSPPHDVEAEESVIGSLLIDGESLEKVHNDLSPQDFYTEKNRLCYKAALSIYESGGGINAVTVTHSLRSTGDLESVGGAPYLAAVVQAVPTSVFVVQYAAIVTRCAQQRALIHAVQNAADTILHPDLLPHRAAEQLSDMFMNAAPIPETETTDLRWQVAMDRLLIEANKSDGERLPTGFRDIDKALMDGIERQSFVVLAADTGVGKTTLALQWARNWAKMGKRVGFLSFEMSASQLGLRGLSAETGIPINEIMSALRHDRDGAAAIMDGIGAESSLPIHVTTRARDVVGIEGWVRRLKRRDGCDVVVIDYLQEMPGRSDNRNLELAAAATRLKQIAVENDLVVLALSQINRVAIRGGKRLTNEAIRDSHGIAQSADVVLFLQNDDEASNKVKLYFGKNRFGPTHFYNNLHFDAGRARFTDWV